MKKFSALDVSTATQHTHYTLQEAESTACYNEQTGKGWIYTPYHHNPN